MTYTIQGAAAWASYLINGDASGLNESDIAECDKWLNKELADNEEIIDCGEPYFSWAFGFHTGSKYSGGDLVEYTVFERNAHLAANQD
jgi:hypothetical protein